MIPRSAHFGLALGAMALAAHADINVPIPAANVSTNYQVGVDTASLAASQIRGLTGATYYVGRASSASLTEGQDSSLTLKYSLVYSTADGPYGTMAGIILPLTPSWDVKDLSAMTSITYQIKVATTGLGIALHIGSNAYPADMAAETSDLTSNYTSALTTAFKEITVLPEDLLPPTWAKAVSAGTTGWIADGWVYTVGIAPYVMDFNFQPVIDGAWNSNGTGFQTTTAAKIKTSNSITIKNVVIHGVSKYPNINGTGCTGPNFVVEDFETTDLYSHKTRSPGAPNYLGGYWYAYSDTSSDPARISSDSAVGASEILLPPGFRAWRPLLGAAAVVNAQLEKNTSAGYHRHAGWAAMGTDLYEFNKGFPLDLTASPYGRAATAIGFDLYAGQDLASILAGASIDTARVARIVFSAGTASTPDNAPFSVSIPLSQVLQPGGNQVCVDFTQLAQPGSYTAVHGFVPFYPNDLTDLSWKIQIEDQSNSAIHSSGPNAFAISNVRFWGVDSSDIFPNGMNPGPVDTTVTPPVDTTVKPPVDTTVKPPEDTTGWHHHRNHHIKHPKPHHYPRFHASYHHGMEVVFPNLRWGGFVDVKRQNGSSVGSFKVNAGSIGKILPLTLKKGTYLVSLRLPGYRETLVVHVD